MIERTKEFWDQDKAKRWKKSDNTRYCMKLQRQCIFRHRGSKAA